MQTRRSPVIGQPAGWMGCALLAALLLGAETRAEGLDLDVLETDDLRLIYLDPFQTYLVPHAARTFHNSLEFQKRVFGWTPLPQG